VAAGHLPFSVMGGSFRFRVFPFFTKISSPFLMIATRRLSEFVDVFLFFTEFPILWIAPFRY